MASDATEQNAGYVKMMRTSEILELIEASPLAFTLAALIALRARYKPGISLKNLHPGEAFIGDYKKCGMSEQQYRTAKSKLEAWKFAKFTPTNKGTVARLIDTRLFDVLNAAANGQANGQATDSQRLTKKDKKGKKEIREGGRTPCASLSGQTTESQPTEADVWAFVEKNEAQFQSAEAVEAFLVQRQREGWTIRGRLIRDWRKALRGFCEKYEGYRA